VTSEATVEGRPAEDWPGARDFAGEWARAIAGTSYVPLTRHDIDALLHQFTVRLADALGDPPADAAAGVSPGYRVGVELVKANFAAPEALGQTVAVLNDRLLACLDLPDAQFRPGLDRLVQALVTGYTRALRDRTLDEQEEIRRAVLVARSRMEARLRASEDERRYASQHDPLTGLPNRTLFMEWLAGLFARASPGGRLAVCAVNLDRFDMVNDSLGQQTGDDLLIAAARRLAGLARDNGYLLARLGGDEFGLIVEDTTGTGDAARVADGILAALVDPIQLDGHRLTVTASVGIVEEAIAVTDPTEVARAARMSLHWAKLDGKSRWVLYDPHRSARYVARYTLSAEMPGALSRGEFALVYQPLVDLADGATRGAEALARWRHPVHGVIAPDGFIDLAEDTGLIVPLGLRLLEQACAQAADWHRLSERAPFVSVNLAVRQLRHPGLLEEIRTVLDETGLPADQLQLEITESAVIGTGDGTIGTLRDLADLGVRLAIDDFGTGYANLAYLRTLPVHALKIDGAFVRSVERPGTDRTGEAILATMVSLAHTLGLSVTAEGVETAAQAKALAELGCDVGQGWHLGLPGAPERITGLLTAAGR
jgi:diguanylate cyclase (GGDEF)-like protein